MEVAAEIQNIVITLFALFVAVLVLTCVCVRGAMKAAEVHIIGPEKVKAAALRRGCPLPFALAPDYDGALVGYVYDWRTDRVRTVYSEELLDAIMATNGTKDPAAQLRSFKYGTEPGIPYPLVIHTK